MRRERHTRTCLVVAWVLLGLAVTAFADPSPGEIIDRTNWEAIEGQVPASLLRWIKKGDWQIQIQKLSLTIGFWARKRLT